MPSNGQLSLPGSISRSQQTFKLAQDDVDLHVLASQKSTSPGHLSPDAKTMLDVVERSGPQALLDWKVTGWGGPGQHEAGVESRYLIGVLNQSYGASIPGYLPGPHPGEGLKIQNCLTLSYAEVVAGWTEYFNAARLATQTKALAPHVKTHSAQVEKELIDEQSPDFHRAQGKKRMAEAMLSAHDGQCEQLVEQSTYDAYLKLLDDVQPVAHRYIQAHPMP
jgi:hypothetical protein